MKQVRHVRRLRRRGRWEVDIQGTSGLAGGDGVLMVVERPALQLRCVALVAEDEDLGGHLRRAALQPGGGAAPSRPQVICCRTEVRPRLQEVAKELGATLKAFL